MQVSWAEEEGPGLSVWRSSQCILDMEIAEKENVLLTICLIDERERESLAWLPSFGGGGERCLQGWRGEEMVDISD